MQFLRLEYQNAYGFIFLYVVVQWLVSSPRVFGWSIYFSLYNIQTLHDRTFIENINYVKFIDDKSTLQHHNN